MAHRIYAGADALLMPSRYEPCGLGQLIAMRYGTVPVVHATGGLADTVQDLYDDPENGNGISFKEYSLDMPSRMLFRGRLKRSRLPDGHAGTEQ